MNKNVKENNNNKENIKHFILFTLFSISAGLIQITSFTLLNEFTGLEEWVSHLIALVLSVVWNFTWNRKITFKSAANVPIAMFKVACFYLVFTPFSAWYVKELNDAGWNEYLVEGTIMVINFITEFIYTKYFVYRNQINTAIKIEPEV